MNGLGRTLITVGLVLLGAGLLIAGIGFAISKDTPRRYS